MSLQCKKQILFIFFLISYSCGPNKEEIKQKYNIELNENENITIVEEFENSQHKTIEITESESSEPTRIYHYYKKGVLKHINNIKENTHSNYYQNGNLKSKANIYYYRGYYLSGNAEIYFQNGKKHFEGWYGPLDKTDNPYKFWNKDGEITEQGSNIYTGMSPVWSEDGEYIGVGHLKIIQHSKSEFKLYRVGVWKLFYDNWNIESISTFSESKFTKKYHLESTEFFDKNGNKIKGYDIADRYKTKDRPLVIASYEVYTEKVEKEGEAYQFAKKRLLSTIAEQVRLSNKEWLA